MVFCGLTSSMDYMRLVSPLKSRKPETLATDSDSRRRVAFIVRGFLPFWQHQGLQVAALRFAGLHGKIFN